MNATTQDWMQLIGRAVVGSMFLVIGLRKVVLFAGNVAYFTKLGFPAPEAMTVLAIIIEIGGAILLIAGWQTRKVGWLLLAFVVIATAMAHRFWEFDSAQYGNQLFHMTKNLAIIGGLLYVIAFGGGALSVDGRKGAVAPRNP